jgi:hypothetical protein
MANIGTLVSSQVATLLRASDAGVGAQMAELSTDTGIEVAAIVPVQILEQSAPPHDYPSAERFPAVYVGCESLSNLQTEKGRRFSGTARVIVECRMTQDRVDGLDAKVRLVADAVAQTLFQSRGQWTDSMFYGGGYEVQYGAMKRGGKNVVQSALIKIEVDIGSN